MKYDVQNSDNVLLIDAETNFHKALPFKIYELKGRVTGQEYHTHDYMQIWYVCKGVCNHWIHNKMYRLVKGDMFVLPPYVAHKMLLIEGEDIHIIGCEFTANFFDDKIKDFTKTQEFFDFAYIEPFLVSEEQVKPKFNICGEAQVMIENIMQEMIAEYTQKDKYYDMLIKADLLKLLTVIAREYGKKPQTQESKQLIKKYRNNIMEAIRYINDNYSQELRLDDICQHCMVSKTYFCYIFKHLTGKTFTEYLIDVRLKKAMELIATEDKTITKICYEVGFNDMSHFCKMFRRVVGVSPNFYKKAMLSD